MRRFPGASGRDGESEGGAPVIKLSGVVCYLVVVCMIAPRDL